MLPAAVAPQVPCQEACRLSHTPPSPLLATTEAVRTTTAAALIHDLTIYRPTNSTHLSMAILTSPTPIPLCPSTMADTLRPVAMAVLVLTCRRITRGMLALNPTLALMASPFPVAPWPAHL